MNRNIHKPLIWILNSNPRFWIFTHSTDFFGQAPRKGNVEGNGDRPLGLLGTENFFTGAFNGSEIHGPLQNHHRSPPQKVRPKMKIQNVSKIIIGIYWNHVSTWFSISSNVGRWLSSRKNPRPGTTSWSWPLDAARQLGKTGQVRMDLASCG